MIRQAIGCNPHGLPAVCGRHGLVPWRACNHSWISLVAEVVVYFVIRHLDFVIPFICVHSWPHVTP